VKSEELAELARGIANTASPDRGEFSSIAAGRAVGGTLGTLAAAAVLSWAAPPTMAAVFLLATLALGGRTIGGWFAARYVRRQIGSSWEQVDLLLGTLKRMGVRQEYLGPLVKVLLLRGSAQAALHNPAEVLRLLPEEAFMSEQRKLSEADQTALEVVSGKRS
jgi:hypothetical protein